MGSRLILQSLLEELLGSTAVYFQAPSNDKMVYPCIVYHIDARPTDYADNGPYRHTVRYQLTVIDRNPDSSIPDRILELPLASFERAFPADKLNHFVINLHF